ncbi:hypothetical protein [Gimesia sp.]|uniref:hypothetical protein n=1 Tax=Gimesia sp. TaxID=2024833 RepID=UPI003A915F02
MSLIQQAQRREFSLDSWESLINDPSRMKLLLAVGRGYTRNFTDSVECLRMMQSHRQFNCQYLVDFDVITDLFSVDLVNADYYRDPNSIKRHRYMIYSWFRHSVTAGRKFCIPWGAFQELMEELNKLKRISSNLGMRRTKKELKREEVLRDVAKALGVADFDQIEMDTLNLEIHKCLQDSNYKLGRLDEFLSPASFRGVKAEYDKRIMNLLCEWLSACPRKNSNDPNTTRHNRKKDPRDQRDALNIAIAIESAIHKLSNPLEKHPLLVLTTSTKIVKDLSNLELLLYGDFDAFIPEERQPQLPHSRRIELLRELKNIFQEKEALSVFSAIPIMDPKSALTAELLNFYERPEMALNTLNQQQQDFQNILSYCSSYLALHQGSESKLDEGVDRLLEVKRNQVIRLIGDVGNRFLTSDDPLHRFECERSIEQGIGRQFRRDDQENFYVGSSSDSIEANSTHFLFAISSVTNKVQDHLCYEYNINVVNAFPPYLKYSISEATGALNDEIIISGECYPAQYDCERLYSNRISTVAFLKEYLDYLDSTFLISANKQVVPETILVEDSSDLWKEGLLIFCGNEWLGMPVTDRSSENLSLIDSFERALKKVKVNRDFAGEKVSVQAAPYQVRLATPDIDIAFDIELLDDELERYVRLISPNPHIKVLVENVTSFLPRVVNPNKFQKILKELFEEIQTQCESIEIDLNVSI